MTGALNHGPELGSYDHILVCMSGKDSLASLLHILDARVDPCRIELHHHLVDGPDQPFMDWPVSAPYLGALAEAFRVPLYNSWREGGLLREMLRDGDATAPVTFETPLGQRTVGGAGKPGTRLRFPQVSADLSTRFCSPVTKIDVLAASIRNQDRFLGRRLLVVTGERAE